MGWFSRSSPSSQDENRPAAPLDIKPEASKTTEAPVAEPIRSASLPAKSLPSSPLPTIDRRDLPLTEPRKQLITFFAGGAFLVASVFITKRSVRRRWQASMPKFYQPNTNPNKVKGIVEAVEALQLATLNVMGGAIMATGGILWALRIRDMNDLKTTYRVYREGEEAAMERLQAEKQDEEKRR